MQGWRLASTERFDVQPSYRFGGDAQRSTSVSARNANSAPIEPLWGSATAFAVRNAVFSGRVSIEARLIAGVPPVPRRDGI